MLVAEYGGQYRAVILAERLAARCRKPSVILSVMIQPRSRPGSRVRRGTAVTSRCREIAGQGGGHRRPGPADRPTPGTRTCRHSALPGRVPPVGAWDDFRLIGLKLIFLIATHAVSLLAGTVPAERLAAMRRRW